MCRWAWTMNRTTVFTVSEPILSFCVKSVRFYQQHWFLNQASLQLSTCRLNGSVLVPSVFLDQSSAGQILHSTFRRRRANSFLEEMLPANLERECYEENCSQEEASEIFQTKEKTVGRVLWVKMKVAAPQVATERRADVVFYFIMTQLSPSCFTAGVLVQIHKWVTSLNPNHPEHWDHSKLHLESFEYLTDSNWFQFI